MRASGGVGCATNVTANANIVASTRVRCPKVLSNVSRSPHPAYVSLYSRTMALVAPPPLDDLGRARPLWDAWIAELAATYGAPITEWKAYSKKIPPALRVAKGKRTIVWLSVREGFFLAFYVLGEKAVAAAPAELAPLLADAPRYPEGRGVRVEVKSAAELPLLRRLTALKLAH